MKLKREKREILINVLLIVAIIFVLGGIYGVYKKFSVSEQAKEEYRITPDAQRIRDVFEKNWRSLKEKQWKGIMDKYGREKGIFVFYDMVLERTAKELNLNKEDIDKVIDKKAYRIFK